MGTYERYHSPLHILGSDFRYSDVAFGARMRATSGLFASSPAPDEARRPLGVRGTSRLFSIVSAPDGARRPSGSGAPRGCFRSVSHPTWHGARWGHLEVVFDRSCTRRGTAPVGVREDSGRPGANLCHAVLPPSHMSQVTYNRPGHSESKFVEVRDHTCRQIRAPETLPTPAGSAASEKFSRPGAKKRLMTPGQHGVDSRRRTPHNARESIVVGAGGGVQ
jgi:hypothetical protein